MEIGGVAQLIEHSVHTRQVSGLNPLAATCSFICLLIVSENPPGVIARSVATKQSRKDCFAKSARNDTERRFSDSILFQIILEKQVASCTYYQIPRKNVPNNPYFMYFNLTTQNCPG